MRRFLLFTVGVLVSVSWACAGEEGPRRFARVLVPVVDLRQQPSRPSNTLDYDPLEESQLLYGDPVEILEERDGWSRVTATEQPEWSHHQRWEGYPGWIESADLAPDSGDWIPNLVVTAKQGVVRTEPATNSPALFTVSLGTRLVGTKGKGWWKLRLLKGRIGWIPQNQAGLLEHTGSTQGGTVKKVSAVSDAELRNRIVRTARLFLGDPYYWGGRSAHNSEPGPPQTGVDCSGLVGLAYQAQGISLPRDAHEIWMRSRPILKGDLLPADLIFLSDPVNPDRVSHVMLYAGGDQIIEGPGTGKPVRQMGLADRLKEVSGRRVTFGRALP